MAKRSKSLPWRDAAAQAYEDHTRQYDLLEDFGQKDFGQGKHHTFWIKFTASHTAVAQARANNILQSPVQRELLCA